MKKFGIVLFVIVLLVLSATVAMAKPDCSGSTIVPGMCDRNDADDNGYPDVGVKVQGRYTLTQDGCEYGVTYGGEFGNDAYLNNGWIINNILCSDGHYNYLIVHMSDPRYTGDPAWSIWGEWEIIVLTESGSGNLVHARPETAVGS